jgi:prepilin-type N-terminal cleavage/methylation domain-containing protein
MRRPSGFTLLEILLALAVLVVVAAMAMPALGPVLDSQRLNQGAEMIRTKWMSTHVKSMRTGKMQMFRYELGGSKFRIEAWTAAEDATEATEADPADPLAGAGLDPQQLQLPDGVIFFAGDAKFENRSMDVEEEANKMGSGDGVSWSRPILFYPDGSTSNAYVLVANEKKQAIRVDLRGLTGSVTVREREKVE